MEFKDSKTYQNLYNAFSGESQARNKYTYFAGVAKKEGYEQMAAIFEETANQEKEHAKRIFKFLKGIGNTAENLQAAAEGENYEWTTMYKEFEKVALEEGYNDIAKFFAEVAKVEEEHEKRYLALLQNLKDGSVFKKEDEVKWQCRNCGHVHSGLEAPRVCPVCVHPQAHFQIMSENY